MHTSDIAAYRSAMGTLRHVAGAQPSVDQDFAAWSATDRELEALTKSGRIADATTLLNTKGNELGDTLAGGLSTIGDRATKEAGTTSASERDSARMEMALFALLAIAGAALMTFFLARSLRNRSRRILDSLAVLGDDCVTPLRDGLQAFAHGDLTVAVNATSEPVGDLGGDELGRIAAAVDDIARRTGASVEAYDASRSSLSQIVSEVASGAESVAGASSLVAGNSDEAGRAVGEIAHAVGDVAQGAERQVRAVDAVRAATDDMTAFTTESAERAQETARVATEARERAQSGVATIRRASDAMVAVSDASQEATAAIHRLGSKSDRIGDIVATITTIAEQTNLLALNAAIEAARAGEHGRGFAVVAEEVRGLAEESQTAAGQISGLISEIQAETRDAVRLVERGGERTEDGARTVEEAHAAFTEIGAEVERMSDEVSHIAEALEQAASAAARIGGDVAEVAAVAEQNSASSEQVSASSQQTSASTQEITASAGALAATATQLQHAISAFTLAESPTAAGNAAGSPAIAIRRRPARRPARSGGAGRGRCQRGRGRSPGGRRRCRTSRSRTSRPAPPGARVRRRHRRRGAPRAVPAGGTPGRTPSAP